MRVSKLEKSIGIETYATHALGIGGVIRHCAEDFVVEEVLVNGSKAEVNAERGDLDSSTAGERYLLCVLVKRNWDTFLAIQAVAKQLGISTQQIHFAGIKDAKAFTAQHITIEGVPSEEVKKINIQDVKIHPIDYFRTKLSAYYLLGNSFRITIRNIKHSKTETKKRITKAIGELEGFGGVPNFFGHQRFGTTRPITHLVGKAIVKGKFKKAAMLFLAKPSPYEHPESMQARKQLQRTQDFKEALQSFPKKLHYERLMLQHLTKKPEDYVRAFRRLPKKLLELFPQAYQAYLFNRFLSKRIESGIPLNAAEVGDYVVSVERSGLPMLTVHKMASVENVNEINGLIKSGRMRLAIPLVGFKQCLSQGVQGEIEKQVLEEEEIEPEEFKIGAIPEISARGELRTAITPLNNFQLEEVSEDNVYSATRMAKISFMLQRGSYGTVFLREIMKPRSLLEAGF